MAKFNYVLSDEAGRKEEGSISAASKEIAIQKLQDKQKIILSINQAKRQKMWFFGRPRMSMQEKMLFVKNLSAMVDVGVSMMEGLEIMSDQTKNLSHKKMFEDIIDKIKAGQTLAESLKKYSNIFPELFTNMIATGEESGNLEQVLRHLDVQMEKDYDTRKKIISALIYPAIIVSITITMAVGIVVFIMPKITKIFRNFDMDLPLPTRLLIGASDAIIANPIISIFAAIILLAAIYFTFKIKALRPILHRIALHLPIMGQLMIEANVARFTRTLSSLLQSGIPITRCLVITSNTLDNTLYKNILKECSIKVEKGGKLSECLEKHEKLFPMLATRMLLIGEKTGTIEITSEKTALIFEKEVDSKTKNLSTLMEPILLVFMAALVGGIALSIIMPIYQLPGLLNS